MLLETCTSDSGKMESNDSICLSTHRTFVSFEMLLVILGITWSWQI